jgi:hypothetical protein
MSNGLNVTVDVGALITALRRSNPHMDLTSVKAYLLDMALAEAEGEDAHSVPAPSPSLHQEPEAVEPEVIPTAPADPKPISLPGIPEGVLGVERPVSRASAPTTSVAPRVTVNRGMKNTADAQTEKERKRAEMARLTAMDSKTLLQQITAGQGRRNEHNQLTDEGVDGPTAGGDLEIG